jgi:hypothetical protein
MADSRVGDRVAWAEKTRGSFAIWISYTIVEFEIEGGRVRVKEGGSLEPTWCNKSHEEELDNAPPELIQQYVDWVRLSRAIFQHIY